ncbi:hypothetical protein M0802_007401 [Mischocyttarus mexicanus]|nr:hypothetical protein M0802_007401 [Mischocyttarus mexicanus]
MKDRSENEESKDRCGVVWCGVVWCRWQKTTTQRPPALYVNCFVNKNADLLGLPSLAYPHLLLSPFVTLLTAQNLELSA